MADILKKLAAVVFLTMLIWAWAYLALEEEMPLQNGTLDISSRIPQDLFVSFENQPAPVSLKLTIKGPPSQIAELKKRLRASDADPNKERLEFLYDAASQNHSTPGSHELDVVKFLNESDKLKDMAVTVVSCEPARINVKVEKLTKKRLTIQCLDENNVPLATEVIDPQDIQMFVRNNWPGTATVILTEAAIEKARKEPVTVTPFIELTPGKRQNYKGTVSITLPSTENPVELRPQQPTIGFIGSKNFWDKYTVELINEPDLRTILLKASERAFIAYEKTAYQILVEILPGDETAADAIHRPVIYNFPEEFVQKGEIKLAGTPGEAIFKLVAAPAKPE
jgi:hypothetical protein